MLEGANIWEEVPRLNLRKGPRLGIPTEMEGQTGGAVLSLMESQRSHPCRAQVCLPPDREAGAEW